MAFWIVKTESDDLEKALEIVRYQRTEVNTAWIEDETSAAVDEDSLGMNERVATRRILPKWFTGWLGGPLFICAFILLGLIVLYLVGLWVDR